MAAIRLQEENEPLFGKAKLQFEIRDPLSTVSPIVSEDEGIYSVKQRRSRGRRKFRRRLNSMSILRAVCAPSFVAPALVIPAQANL